MNLALALDELQRRGFDLRAFGDALAADDEDAVALAHPINWMTEEEAEGPCYDGAPLGQTLTEVFAHLSE
jgi:hypothetical protein